MPEGTRFITVELSDETFRSLIKMAGTQGFHPYSFASLMVVRGMKEFAESDADPQSRLFLLAQDMADNRYNYQAVVTVLKYLNEYPDDKKMDEMIKICDEMGIDINLAQRNALSEMNRPLTLTEIGSRASKVDKAKQFLSEQMQPGVEYSASALIAAGEAAGFTYSQLSSARRALEITSYRGADSFVWVIPAYDVSENLKHD